MSEIIYYHALPASGHTRYSDEPVQVGTIIRAEGTPKLCGKFPHASKRAIDTLKYCNGQIIFEGVYLRGNVLDGDYKSCANERETVWMLSPKASKRILRQWALWCATRALENERKAGREPDPRSWDALATIRKFLNGEATLEEMRAARAAAYAAYAAAADAADAAAADAARAAAADAAYAAAYAAADAARAAAKAAYAAAYAAADAARAADAAAQNTELERLIALEVAKQATI